MKNSSQIKLSQLPFLKKLGVVLVFVISLFATTACKRDNESPVIRLKGPDSMITAFGQPFPDPGVIAFDDKDFDISDQVVVDGNLNLNYLGDYQVRYTVTDKSGKQAIAYRNVRVVPSPLSMVGTFRSINNCPTCETSGLATVRLDAHDSTVIHFFPAFGTYEPPNPLDNTLSQRWYEQMYVSYYGKFRCAGNSSGYRTSAAASANVSNDLDTITVDLKLHDSPYYTYCFVVYVRE